jgi:dTDP-4-dehydrorhamnose reductase
MTQLKDNKSIELFTDVYTHPTHVEDLSNFIINVIINKVYGVFHACASDFVNRYKLAKLFCKVNGLNSDLLLPAIRGKANLPKNINMKPSKEFLEIANISLEEGLNYNFEKMEARYAI